MEAISNFVNNMNHIVKKTDVQEQYNKMTTSLNNDLLPMMEELKSLAADNNINMDEIKELVNFNRNSGIKAKNISELVLTIYSVLENMNKMSSELSGLIDKDLPDLLSKEAITVKQASIMVVIGNYGNVVLFTSDIILYIIGLLDKKLNGKALSFIKAKLLEIQNTLYSYSKVLEFFITNKNIIKDLSKQSNDRVLSSNGKSNSLLALSSFKSKIKLVGFIGNPIYHFRMWLVDREISSYETLKEKKKLTELAILDLRARQNGEVDPKIQKAIEYHEDKLDRIEYKIRKIEEA